MKHYLLIAVTLLLAWSLVCLATEEIPAIGISSPANNGTIANPQQGKAVRLMISHASYPQLEAFTVSVTYHPNSLSQKIESIGSADADGYLSWIPKEAGMCLITAVAPDLENAGKKIEITKSVSVSSDNFPATGFFILGFAVLLLLAGLIFSFTRLKKS